jgi:ribosomal protein L37AE/L43A
MAATFIDVRIQDLEAHFGCSRKDNPNLRAFDLIRPEGEEAYYLCRLRETDNGTLYVKVLTSVRSDRNKARGCGEDAIRIFLLWEDKDGWTACVGKTKRVNRAGGQGKTADDVAKRAINRAREVAREHFRLPWCSKCGRPLVQRRNKAGWPFLGCSAYAQTKCSG